MVYWVRVPQVLDIIRPFAREGEWALITASLSDGTILIRRTRVPHGDPPSLSARLYPHDLDSEIVDSMADGVPVPLVMCKITSSAIDPEERNATDITLALAPMDLNVYASLLGEGFIFTDVHCSDTEERG
jgi:hypothetical protein